MGKDNKQIDALLNLFFYILALGCAALYFLSKDPAANKSWLYVGIAAIVVRVISYIRKYFF